MSDLTILTQVEDAFNRDADEAEEEALRLWREHLQKNPITPQQDYQSDTEE